MKRVMQEVQLQPLKIESLMLKIRGTSPLLMNKFSDRSKKEMLDKQLKKSKERKARDIKTEVIDAIHRLPNGKIGIPAASFKRSFTEAAPYIKGMDKKLVRGSLFIIGSLLPLKYRKQTVNESICRLQTGVRMVRFRPEFSDWSTILPIRFNSAQISPDQIVELANVAGFHIGVGDWRPICSGSYGMFEVEDD